MADEDASKISRFPSGYKRKKTEGAYSPPIELTEEEKKPEMATEEKESRRTEYEKPFSARPTSGDYHESKLPLLIAVIAFIIALLAIGIAFMAYSDMQKTKIEASAIAKDLKEIQSKPIQLRKTVSTPAKITAEIPLSQVLAGTTIPLTGTLQINGSGKARSPTLGIFDVQIEAIAPLNQKVTLQQTAFTEQDKLKISSDTPLSIDVTITTKAEEFWGDQLDDIINRLEKISK